MNTNYKKHMYALITAGGGGTRLWPRSRNKTPKQFLKLFKNKTLMEITVDRFRKMLPVERIYCVTVSEEYKKEILRLVPDFKPGNIIVEPSRRDTGPAHGLGASYIYKKDPDAVIVTEAADRLVDPVSGYLSTLEKAAEVAYGDKVLISIGVKPRYAHTGLGHIKRGDKYTRIKGANVYKVDKFVEKPPLALAKKYTKSQKYYWNAGQYVWRADVLLAEIQKYEPGIYANLSRIMESIGRSDEKQVIHSSYEKMPKIPIDMAVSEKTKNLYLIPGHFFWTDIGDWKEVWNNLTQDNFGNVIIDGEEIGGEVINIDTSDALIHKNGRLIAIIDVDNVVVVDTKDALLICSKSKAQNVKKIVDIIKETGRTDLL